MKRLLLIILITMSINIFGQSFTENYSYIKQIKELVPGEWQELDYKGQISIIYNYENDYSKLLVQLPDGGRIFERIDASESESEFGVYYIGHYRNIMDGTEIVLLYWLDRSYGSMILYDEKNGIHLGL